MRDSQTGVTLIELIVSMVIIAISLTGVLLVFTTTVRHSGDPMQLHQAVAIGEAYLEEILLREYLDPDTGTVCPASEAGRSLYDNVCDYDGLNDNGARDQTGAAIPGLGSYRIQVNVDQAATLSGTSATLGGSGSVLRVDVTVNPPVGSGFSISGYKTNS